MRKPVGTPVHTIILFGVSAALLALQPAATAQQNDVPPSRPTFKSSVDLVPISATVRDRRGRMVTSLTSADFEVLDNGQRRPIIDFQADHSSAITLAALLDVSGSMRIGPKMGLASQVITRLASALQDGRSEIGLFTFDSELHESQPFTSAPLDIERALSHARPFGSTSLYDAIAETARRLQARSAPRRAIVVITDGLDTSSKLTPSEVSSLASSIDVPVYVVVTVPPVDRAEQLGSSAGPTGERASADLRELAFWTGGDLLWATAGSETSVRADQILNELRHQYLIAIESALEREWRQIDVRVRDRALTVRARSGYFSRQTAALANPR